MKILELHLYSDNLEETENFYATILGLPLESTLDGILSFYAGSSLLRFRKSIALQPVYHFAFNVTTELFPTIFQRLNKVLPILDIRPSSKIANFVNWKARAFYFLDNNGNILECIAREELEIDQRGLSELASISEIGMVSKDPGSLQKQVTRHFGLPIFPRQEPQENFIAMGSDEGLFILVAEQRPWFPTKIPSQTFPGKVKFSIDGKVQELDLSHM